MSNIPFLYHSYRRPPRIVLNALREAAPNWTFTWVNKKVPEMSIQHRATKSTLRLGQEQALFLSGDVPRIIPGPVGIPLLLWQRYSFEFFALSLEGGAKELDYSKITTLRQRMVMIFDAFDNGRLTHDQLQQPWYNIGWLNELNSTDRGIIMRCAIESLRSLAVYYWKCAICNQRTYSHFRNPDLILCGECSQHLKNA